MAMNISIPNPGAAINPNPLGGIGQAIAQGPQVAAQQEAALQKTGWDTLAPYIQAMSKNPKLATNPQYTGMLTHLASRYRIDPTLVSTAIQQTADQVHQASYKQAADQAGAPAPTGTKPTAQTQPGNPAQPWDMDATQAATPGMEALMGAAGIKDTGLQGYGTMPLPAGSAQDIQENTDPNSPQRAARYANAGIDPRTVPAWVMGAPRQMTMEQQSVAYNDIVRQIPSYISKGLDVTALLQSGVTQGAMTQGQMDGWLTNPEFVSQAQQAARANLSVLMENGLLKKNQAAKAYAGIAETESVTAVNGIRQNILGKQLSAFDTNEQLKVEQASATIDHLQSLTATEAGGTWAQQMQVAQRTAQQAQTAYATLLNAGARAIAANGDPSQIVVGNGTNGQPQSFTDALAAAKATRDTTLEAAQSLSKNYAPTVAGDAAQRAQNGGVVKGQGQPPPLSAEYTKAGWKVGQQNGERGYVDPTGKFYPYKPNQ
jgi:hypothetical protein